MKFVVGRPVGVVYFLELVAILALKVQQLVDADVFASIGEVLVRTLFADGVPTVYWDHTPVALFHGLLRLIAMVVKLQLNWRIQL